MEILQGLGFFLFVIIPSVILIIYLYVTVLNGLGTLNAWMNFHCLRYTLGRKQLENATNVLTVPSSNQ